MVDICITNGYYNFMTKRNLIQQSFYIYQDQKEDLIKIADGRAFSTMVRKAIDFYLKEEGGKK